LLSSGLSREAVGADADDLDRVGSMFEAVALRRPRHPGVDLAALELLDAMAARADEVVVVSRAAEPVTTLPGVVYELVDDILLAQDGQRPIDRREADPLAALAQPRVDLLSCGVVRLGGECLEHEEPLGGRADADADETLEKLDGFPFFACHGDDYDTPTMRLIVIIIFTCGLVLTACGGGRGGGSHTAGGSGQETVVAAFYPLAFAASEIGGASVDVKNLTPPGAEPHDLEVSPQDVAEIRDADLVLLLGRGFQPQLEDAAGNADEVVRLLDTPGLDVHSNGDPHVWLDPVRFALVVERIGQVLGKQAAADELKQRLMDLNNELRVGLAHCERREIVTSHEAFAYLAERYGLEQVAITGLSPEAEPEPGKLEHVVDLVRAHGVTTVYFETLVSPRIAETVARETGAKTAVLNPIEGLTAEESAGGEDYFSLMRENLTALRTGLGCS
jgi:zinc transport system substrate-binding protein